MRAATAALMLLSVWTTAPLRGAVIFTDVPDVNLMAGGFGGEASYNVDFNGDGLHEVNVFSRFGDFGASARPHSSIAGIPNSPPDSNGFAHPFAFGSLIAPIAPDFRSWNQGVSGMLGCQETGCIGLWTSGGINYIGVEFELETGTHYGWIAIEMQFLFGGGHLLSYAYESDPNMPIIAGAIPEPSSSVFVGVATASLLLRRRRK